MLKFFILFVFIFGFLQQIGNLKSERYLKLSCLFLFLLMGLRNKLCFLDTPGYVYKYLQVSQLTLTDAFAYDTKDPIFWVLSSLIGRITGADYTIWLLLCSAPFVLGLYRLIKNHSENSFISLSVLMGLGFFVFLFTGIRQTVAIGFVILALSYILESKYLHFVIYTVIAALFHKTAIVFIVMLAISNIKVNKKTLFLYTVILLALMALGSLFLKDFIFLQVMDYDDRFASYEDDTATLSNMGLYKQLFIFIISLALLWKKNRSKEEDILINAAAIGILFQSMSSSIAEMFRISMYFSVANTILLPLAINRMYQTNNKQMLSIAIPLLIFVYILIANSSTGWNLDYHFFFEHISSIKE